MRTWKYVVALIILVVIILAMILYNNKNESIGHSFDLNYEASWSLASSKVIVTNSEHPGSLYKSLSDEHFDEIIKEILEAKPKKKYIPAEDRVNGFGYLMAVNAKDDGLIIMLTKNEVAIYSHNRNYEMVYEISEEVYNQLKTKLDNYLEPYKG